MGQKKTTKKSKPKVVSTQQKEADKAEEKPFDFGGIPERDLKKNLGCG